MRAPSRITLALGADMAFKLSRDFSALKCCTVPSTALRMSTAKMTMVLSASPVAREIRAAAMRIITIRSLNCSRNTWSTVFFLPSLRALGPYCSRRRAASVPERPCCRLLFSWERTWPDSSVCQSRFSVSMSVHLHFYLLSVICCQEVNKISRGELYYPCVEGVNPHTCKIWRYFRQRFSLSF